MHYLPSELPWYVGFSIKIGVDRRTSNGKINVKMHCVLQIKLLYNNSCTFIGFKRDSVLIAINFSLVTAGNYLDHVIGTGTG